MKKIKIYLSDVNKSEMIESLKDLIKYIESKNDTYISHLGYCSTNTDKYRWSISIEH